MEYPIIQDSNVFIGKVIVSKHSRGGVVVEAINRPGISTWIVLSPKQARQMSRSLVIAARYTDDDKKMGRKNLIGP